MIIIIDTSSLLSLVRYYLPFDKNGILFEFIKGKVESGEIIILDKVYKECKYTAKGIVTEKLTYLQDKSTHINTTELLPDPTFFTQLETQFINGSAKNKLDAVQFEKMKSEYLESADAKILLYALKHKNDDNIVIVTEETLTSNDNKSFKKIPAICEILTLDCKTLPELIDLFDEIDFEIR